MGALTIDECQKACSEETSFICKSVNFYPSDGYCFLYDKKSGEGDCTLETNLYYPAIYNSEVSYDNFDAEWLGKLAILNDGDYTFTFKANDQAELWIGGIK